MLFIGIERIPKKLETPETRQKIEEVRTKTVTTKVEQTYHRDRDTGLLSCSFV